MASPGLVAFFYSFLRAVIFRRNCRFCLSDDRKAAFTRSGNHTGRPDLPVGGIVYADTFPEYIATFGTSLVQPALLFHKQLRYSVFFLVIAGAIALRLSGANGWTATVAGLIVGIIGLGIMLILSRRKKKMIHCSSYCPIGTLVSFMKYLSPFRVKLNTDCTHCMACLKSCKYDALHKENIEKGKIGYTCTYCGDCLSACKHGGLEYRFFRLRPATAERLWIIITVVLHTCFLMIARI